MYFQACRHMISQEITNPCNHGCAACAWPTFLLFSLARCSQSDHYLHFWNAMPGKGLCVQRLNPTLYCLLFVKYFLCKVTTTIEVQHTTSGAGKTYSPADAARLLPGTEVVHTGRSNDVGVCGWGMPHLHLHPLHTGSDQVSIWVKCHKMQRGILWKKEQIIACLCHTSQHDQPQSYHAAFLCDCCTYQQCTYYIAPNCVKWAHAVKYMW